MDLDSQYKLALEDKNADNGEILVFDLTDNDADEIFQLIVPSLYDAACGRNVGDFFRCLGLKRFLARHISGTPYIFQAIGFENYEKGNTVYLTEDTLLKKVSGKNDQSK